MTLSRTGPAVLAGLAAALLYPLPRPAAGEEAAPAKPGKVEYNRDVRPILAENCFACHGADSAARKADLRIDRREDAVDSGAVVPGKPDQSKLIERVLTDEPSEVMPPPKTKKTLTAAQKDVLKRWVEQGAEYEAHWSLLPPKRHPVPEFPDDPKAKAWVRTPIDAFVYARLKAAGLEPAPEADRRTLARRLSLDLIGLPPEPADVEAFVNDASPDYYGKYVDKLMASPHWGEHRGRFWLDAARYADTHGIHFDNYREVWAYRDWVIEAFNRNLPFDRFTVEQLAGDLLPNPTLEQRIASGFNRMNITTNEGGAIDEEYLVLYARDRTETTAAVWLGLTAGCAVCHDHKYDPISMKDFYRLSAFFNNTTQRAMDGNIKDTPPVIPVPMKEDRPRWEALGKEVAAAKAKLDARRAAARPAFEGWLKETRPAAVLNDRPADGLAFAGWFDEGAGATARAVLGGRPLALDLPAGAAWQDGPFGGKALAVKPAEATVRVPGAGDFEADRPFTVALWVRAGGRAQPAAALLARMDNADGHRGWDLWLDGDKLAAHLVHKWPSDAVKVSARKPIKPADWVHVALVWDGSRKPTGLTLYVDGEPQPADVTANGRVRQPVELAELTAPAGSTRTTAPLTVGRRTGGDAVRQVAVQDVRLYDRRLSADDITRLARSAAAAAAVGKPADGRTPAEAAAAFDWYLTARDGEYRALAAAAKKLQDEEAAIKARGTVAHVMSEKDGEPTAYVLFRGDYDKRRDKVTADTPTALPPMGKDLPRNRLGLARWLLAPEHPLTTRVTVNRFWQELYGNGLVRTSGDFGISGELPSHPELLDWLAPDFRTDWDVKRFFKLLVTSATYRQAAVATPGKLAKDRDNTLLSRGPRFRMDAEMVRDYALAASGLLVPKVGGPSVRPYQPPGVWEAVAMPESNTRLYKPDGGENLYRRSMYTFWKRAAPPASMEVLNAPNRETCTVRRERTNTPLQALLTLNDVQFVEAARVLAEAALKASGEDAGRLDFLAKKLLARPFRPAEVEVLTESLAELRAHYRAKPEDAKKLIAFGERKADPALDPAELAAWAMLANQLLNLDEVLNK
jgi:cytochrome c553